jgi:hypothetical protein
MLHPGDTLDTLDSEWCLGPLDPLTLPIEEKVVLTESELARQAARDGMPSVESMLLLHDFEIWAERILSDTAWSYYRSAADEERSKSLPFLSGYVFVQFLYICKEEMIAESRQPFSKTVTLSKGTFFVLAF